MDRYISVLFESKETHKGFEKCIKNVTVSKVILKVEVLGLDDLIIGRMNEVVVSGEDTERQGVLGIH